MARTKGKKRKWSVVHPRAAGIDIGSRFHVVAVSEDLDAKPVRTFSTFTNDLHRLAEWLKGLGIATVAMESTGVYWIPAFEILQARGVEVVLVNARNAKTVPGRKTDVNDAQWLQQLHQYGLLRGSFHPSRGVAALRAYLRHRERLLDYAAAHVQHMHKALTQMNVQLHHVVSDVTGATGLRIIRAIVSGNTDPEELARFRDVRCKASPETIREALFALLGVDLTQIHGLGPYVALKLVSECGTDMTKWPSAKHFTSWLCLAPGNKISGGKVLSSRTRRSSNRAASLLRLAATAVGRTDTALGAFYRRLSARVGKAKAITATARKLAVLFYNAMRYGMEYADPGASYYEERYRQRVVANLRRRAKSMGFVLQEAVAEGVS